MSLHKFKKSRAGQDRWLAALAQHCADNIRTCTQRSSSHTCPATAYGHIHISNIYGYASPHGSATVRVSHRPAALGACNTCSLHLIISTPTTSPSCVRQCKGAHKFTLTETMLSINASPSVDVSVNFGPISSGSLQRRDVAAGAKGGAAQMCD